MQIRPTPGGKCQARGVRNFQWDQIEIVQMQKKRSSAASSNSENQEIHRLKAELEEYKKFAIEQEAMLKVQEGQLFDMRRAQARHEENERAR